LDGLADRASLLAALKGAEGALGKQRAVALPDLFIDHIVSLPKWGETQKQVAATVLRGGGNIRGGVQHLAAGGNAFNAARALSRLGVATKFVGHTSRSAVDFAASSTHGERVDSTLVRIDGRTSMTASLEMGTERSNVMFNDPGSLEGLTAADLAPGAREAVGNADAVLVANWAGNRAQGTEFAKEVLAWAKGGGAATFLDPSDAWGRDQDVLRLAREVCKGEHLDWLLVNEPELREVSRVYILNDTGESPCAHDDFEGQARELTRHLRCAVASHRRQGSQSHRSGAKEAALEWTAIEPQRMTGAGDVWNAGFIAGVLLGLSPVDRLQLAHATARVYVSRAAGPPPTLAEVRQYLVSTSDPA
jgi:sugar/nucleoside kinase (ribokinase family)